MPQSMPNPASAPVPAALLAPDALAAWRAGKPMPVLVSGSFELLQPGNLAILRAAGCLDGPLIALVTAEPAATSSAAVGQPRPAADRAETVAHMRDVDAVTVLPDAGLDDALAALAPYAWVTCLGADDADPWRDRLRTHAQELVNLPLQPGCRSGEILAAIRERRTPVTLPGAPAAPPAPPAPADGARPVSANGCFDILHVGHLRFLQAARALGDSLTVLINTDDSVRRYKGSERPIFPAAFRAAALAALRSVDAVWTFDADTPIEALRILHPRVHAKGGTFEPERVREEASLLAEWGGEIAFCDLVDGYSTTTYLRGAVRR